MPDTLTFANPIFFLLLVGLVPLVFLRFRSQRLRAIAVDALVATRLRDRLLVGQRPASHWARFTLQLLALAFLITALAGPRYGFDEEETIAEGRNVLIGIDTSRSMLAPDLKPDRLTRAKLAAHDLIRSLPGDRFGLIAFAGTSFLQAPLTVDHEAVIESITQLDTEIIPRGGTNLGRALDLARETFADAESENNAVILFSDGEDLETRDLTAAVANDPEAAPITVIAVGTGTAAGSIIPDLDASTPGQFIRDSQGEIVRSRLDATKLKSLAETTGGLYLHLDSTAAMRKVVTSALDRLEKSAMEGRTIYKPIDRYRWALFPAILLALLSLTPLPTHASLRQPAATGPRSLARPSAAGVLVLSFSIFHSPFSISASASPLEAYRQYQSGDFENAAFSYDDAVARKTLHSKERLHYGSASAAYQLGDYQKAIQSYGQALLSKKPEIQERAHYSLGNALYREGETRLEGEKPDAGQAIAQWRNALDHYDASLALNEANEDAQYNRDLVAKRIEELEKQQQQQEQQQQQDQENQDEQKQDQENQDQEKQDDQQQQQQQGQDGDQPQEDQQEKSEGDEEQEEQKPDQGEQEPEEEPMEEPETPEGELEAEENPQEQQGQQPPPSEQPHPETGFTPSQARQILRSLADEDLDVRPLVPPSREPVFKNW